MGRWLFVGWAPYIQVREYQQKMNKYFDCNDAGELHKYVGYKVKRNVKEGIMEMTQLFLIQSFMDKFNIPNNNQLVTPASQWQINLIWW
jgi:hypothetical protein